MPLRRLGKPPGCDIPDDADQRLVHIAREQTRNRNVASFLLYGLRWSFRRARRYQQANQMDIDFVEKPTTEEVDDDLRRALAEATEQQRQELFEALDQCPSGGMILRMINDLPMVPPVQPDSTQHRFRENFVANMRFRGINKHLIDALLILMRGAMFYYVNEANAGSTGQGRFPRLDLERVQRHLQHVSDDEIHRLDVSMSEEFTRDLIAMRDDIEQFTIDADPIRCTYALANFDVSPTSISYLEAQCTAPTGDPKIHRKRARRGAEIRDDVLSRIEIPEEYRPLVKQAATEWSWTERTLRLPDGYSVDTMEAAAVCLRGKRVQDVIADSNRYRILQMLPIVTWSRSLYPNEYVQIDMIIRIVEGMYVDQRLKPILHILSTEWRLTEHADGGATAYFPLTCSEEIRDIVLPLLLQFSQDELGELADRYPLLQEINLLDIVVPTSTESVEVEALMPQEDEPETVSVPESVAVESTVDRAQRHPENVVPGGLLLRAELDCNQEQTDPHRIVPLLLETVADSEALKRIRGALDLTIDDDSMPFGFACEDWTVAQMGDQARRDPVYAEYGEESTEQRRYLESLSLAQDVAAREMYLATQDIMRLAVERENRNLEPTGLFRARGESGQQFDVQRFNAILVAASSLSDILQSLCFDHLAASGREQLPLRTFDTLSTIVHSVIEAHIMDYLMTEYPVFSADHCRRLTEQEGDKVHNRYMALFRETSHAVTGALRQAMDSVGESEESTQSALQQEIVESLERIRRFFLRFTNNEMYAAHQAQNQDEETVIEPSVFDGNAIPSLQDVRIVQDAQGHLETEAAIVQFGALNCLQTVVGKSTILSAGRAVAIDELGEDADADEPRISMNHQSSLNATLHRFNGPLCIRDNVIPLEYLPASEHMRSMAQVFGNTLRMDALHGLARLDRCTERPQMVYIGEGGQCTLVSLQTPNWQTTVFALSEKQAQCFEGARIEADTAFLPELACLAEVGAFRGMSIPAEHLYCQSTTVTPEDESDLDEDVETFVRRHLQSRDWSLRLLDRILNAAGLEIDQGTNHPGVRGHDGSFSTFPTEALHRGEFFGETVMRYAAMGNLEGVRDWIHQKKNRKLFSKVSNG